MKHINKLYLFLLFNLLLLNSISAQQFKFAWISDTHVGSSTGVTDLINSVQDINSMTDIDFVILSGDITENGKNSDLELTKKILDSLSKPYYIIPGNHDTKWSESGCTKFSQVFGNDKFDFNFNGIRFIGMHQGPIMRMGDGHFSPEDLRWLDSILSFPDENPIIFVTHYPLDNSIDNWFEVIERLKKHDTRVVLCGHGHSNRALNFEGIPGVMGRSNLRAKDKIGGFNLVKVTSDSIYFSERIPGIQTKLVWHKIPLSKIDYTYDEKEYPRPDYSINAVYPNVKVKWVYKTNYTITSAPVIYNEKVIATSGSGAVYSLNLNDGKLIWQFKTDGAIYGSPDVANDKVVFGSNDNNIYCLNLSDGRLNWKYETEAPIVAVPKIFNDAVYVGGGDGKFRAINLSNGKLIWEYSSIEEFVETKPLIYKNKVIFGSWDTYLYALNIADGSLAWKWQGGKGFGLSPAACWPVASNDKVFIAAPDRFMSAIDSETGKTIWRTNVHQVREAIGISEDGKYIYAKCMNDTLLVFSALSQEPTLIKAIYCDYGYDIDPAMIVEKDGVIFLGTKNGLVIALDNKTFEILWKYKIGNSLINTPAPVDGKRVLITNMDGEVIFLEGK